MKCSVNLVAPWSIIRQFLKKRYNFFCRIKNFFIYRNIVVDIHDISQVRKMLTIKIVSKHIGDLACRNC